LFVESRPYPVGQAEQVKAAGVVVPTAGVIVHNWHVETNPVYVADPAPGLPVEHETQALLAASQMYPDPVVAAQSEQVRTLTASEHVLHPV